MPFHGLQLPLRTFTGASAVRVVHPANQRIEEHRHEHLCLDIHVIGGYTDLHEDGQVAIGGPSVVLHPLHEPHANHIAAAGMEAIGIQIEPDWLRSVGFDCRPRGTRCWVGGKVAAAASWLASVWMHPPYAERDVARATARFLRFALAAGPETRPVWLDGVARALDIESAPRTIDLARSFALHPAWLARAYRAAVGEGIQETLKRKRVERAVSLLRGSDDSIASIAADVGFCDQSHMNRVFRAMLGRSPLHVRAERSFLRDYPDVLRDCVL
jgi:AraC family transcriptional regulator